MSVPNPQVKALEQLIETVNAIPNDDLTSIAHYIRNIAPQHEGGRLFNDLADVSKLLLTIVDYRKEYAR